VNRATSGVILVLVAGLGMAATYFAQHASAPGIAAQQRLIDSRNLLDMLSPDSYDNQPLERPLTLTDSTLANSTLLAGYRATKANQPSAILLRSQTTGYAGTLELLIAIDVNGKLLGVKTLKQSETPGLGARIADSPNGWLHVFSGLSLAETGDNVWALKKDHGQFDQIAGATITSRAAINAIHDALRYFDEHRQALIGVNSHG
jgi:electron transport complex protein RnfG